MRAAAGIAVGLAAVFTVYALRPDPEPVASLLPPQDPELEVGEVVEPADATVARALLAEVTALSITVREIPNKRLRIRTAPWEFEPRIVLLREGDALRQLCDAMAADLEMPREAGRGAPAHELSLHLVNGRRLVANLIVAPALRLQLRGLGAWLPGPAVLNVCGVGRAG